MKLLQRFMRRAGFEVHRIKPPFVPIVRHFEFTGTPFDFWIANPDASWWYEEEGWSKAGEFKELTLLVRPGDRVLEIGSHHGFTGLICAILAGKDGFVLGLEAHPENALIGTAQLGLNPSIRNLRIINAAGANEEGRVRITPDHNSSVSLGGVASVEVPAKTGDALDAECGPFTVLKMDVEGFEGTVLKGCKEILRRRPKLAIEVHIDSLAQYGGSVAEVFQLLSIEDYEGNMVIRPDYETVWPFALDQIPATGIVNLFLSPRQPANSELH